MRRMLVAGHDGLLVECEDLEDVMALHRSLEASRPAGVIDLVPAARTLLLTFDATTSRSDLVAAVTRAGAAEAGLAHPVPEVVIEVTYDGEDLAEVAELTGIPADEVVRRHQAADHVVAFTGFAPGFAYIAGGDPALVVPRRDTPRTRVPAGSVALAGEFTGIYPREGPGGWQLIGRTDSVLWDLRRENPALLTPGAPVRFTEAGS
ncbi:5-oxoprolinase subunit B family protein [Knoellia sp. Soil729]|uniref:5-oxoprolinase subunit B family protein n=1 Tax=Knoellia sp. Soil729 TaxID=1736394 RepID=UPI0006FB579E|nr:allophanate hydrolase subunit 1 [Knoellia sp. Soil729]KRE42961.1 allophanate hydrolase [Knoellia sp. Soil729]